MGRKMKSRSSWMKHVSVLALMIAMAAVAGPARAGADKPDSECMNGNVQLPDGAVCVPESDCVPEKTCNKNGKCVGPDENTRNDQSCNGGGAGCHQTACSKGLCVEVTPLNDCGSAQCGTSSNGCYSCPSGTPGGAPGACAAGSVCTAGVCVVQDPCAGVTCGDCQKCAAGVCVADGDANGKLCGAGDGALCFQSTCSNGACGTLPADNDGTPPTITCSADQTVECVTRSGTAVISAVATDTCSTPTNDCGTPTEKTFPLGATTNTCTAIDANGDKASCTSTVTVVDTTLPMVKCTDPAYIKTSDHSGLCSASLAVNATATDTCDGVLPTTCDQTELSLSQPGWLTASCSATDGANNKETCSTKLTLVDDTAPVITGPVGGSTQFVLGSCGGTTLDLGVKATDNCGSVKLDCTTVAGNAFGANAVTCTATDPWLNTSTLTYTLVVLEPLRVVFTSPIADDNVADDYTKDADATNRFQVGSTIPHKVTLNNCQGANVTTSVGVTVKLAVSERTSDAPTGAVADIAAVYNGVGDAGSLLVLTDGQYHYNLLTRGYEAGTVNNNRYFQSIVTVSYNNAPGIVAGAEDAHLESK
jgi:hypothetical protein